MSGYPTVSFVVPAYNEEALLPETLAAIRRAIARAGCTAEIIVVNNASTDRTAQVAGHIPGVRVIEEPIKGLVRARQAGFLAATGQLIANIDADTRVSAGWLSRVIAAFADNPKLAALSGPYVYYDVPAYVNLLVRLFYGVGCVLNLANRWLLGTGTMLQGGNFVVRRAALEAIGGYGMDFNFYGEDTDLARRLNAVGDVRWTFDLPARSSGRRLLGEGLIATGARYAMNFIWATFLKRPFTQTWNDLRTDPTKL
jgi:glycosyltransferase involved in cell wall biosynthesis